MISLLRGLMASDDGTNRPLPSLILLGIVDFVCILMAAESYRDRQFFAGTVWLVVGIAASLIGYYWQQIKLKLGIGHNAEPGTKRPPSLEIRPLPGQELQSFRELRGYTHYRMEIYNSDTETAHNVQVRLVGIEPRPVCQQFCADFPYVVRLAHLEGETDASVSRDINPRTSQSFELLFFWESSDHRTMVDGIDTKHALSRDACFSIEDKECRHLKYEVSSATTGIQKPSFLMRCEGNNLVMRRLI